MSHLGLMSVYALLTSVFFAFLWRRDKKERIKLFAQLFVGLMAGAIALGWLMYPFPSAPPAPIP